MNLDNNHRNNNPDGGFYGNDSDSADQKSCVVDRRLPGEHSGGVFQNPRAHTIKIFHSDSFIEERNGSTHRTRSVTCSD